ncbi:MAG: ABC transporter ATP-binding protein [Clostridiales Family XIII bacterium]|nr:ABC transporter ATP-binding protein [Clostridiales Family XIII bacterium]
MEENTRAGAPITPAPLCRAPAQGAGISGSTAADTTLGRAPAQGAGNKAGGETGSEAEKIIEIRDLEKVYRNGAIEVAALRGVSLDIHKGEFVAIMGTSGSGKSTFMNILGCLDRPTGGIYCLEGLDINEYDDNELSLIRNQKVGFVFQSFNLIPRTSALKNVELPMVYGKVPAAKRHARAHALLDKVGLGDRYGHMPNELSGGQRQRVAIARALTNHPPILLADEPTGNLDSKSSIEIMELFAELNNDGNTVILVTHEPDIAEWAHRVITFRDGLIISDRTNPPKAPM